VLIHQEDSPCNMVLYLCNMVLYFPR